jgi:hypothetical protein
VSALGLSPAERARLAALGPASLSAALVVFTGDGVPPPDTPSVDGACVLDEEGLHFRPRFPFVSGIRYTTRLDLGRGALLLHRFEVSPPAGPVPRVVAVFPSADTLPENVLRLYLHFSQPMSVRDSHRHVRLRDDSGADVPLAFVEIEHGLWDPRQTRLSVLLHPGRIKRGVAPGERLGPPLVAGRAYRLVVDAAMTDAWGRPLAGDFEKRFRAVAADREPPTERGLRLHAPASPGDPLAVDLPEPLDEALLHRLLWVEDASGSAVPGTITVEEGETRWTFQPARPWSPGVYALRVHPALEDRAGNRFDRVFDRETPAADAESQPAPPLQLAFAVSPER